MKFSQLMEVLGLSTTHLGEILAATPKQIELWQLHDAPQTVTEQLLYAHRVIHHYVRKWVKYAKWHYQQGMVLGIPIYMCATDFHACDPDFARKLKFLPLYQHFTARLLESLAKAGIDAKTVMITPDTFREWLANNDFANSPGAKMVYASLVLAQKSDRNS